MKDIVFLMYALSPTDMDVFQAEPIQHMTAQECLQATESLSIDSDAHWFCLPQDDVEDFLNGELF